MSTMDLPSVQEKAEQQYIQELLRTGKYSILRIRSDPSVPNAGDTSVNPASASKPSLGTVPLTTTRHSPIYTSTPSPFVRDLGTPTPEREYRQRRLTREPSSVTFNTEFKVIDDLQAPPSLASPIVSAFDDGFVASDVPKYQPLRQSVQPQRLDSYTLPYDGQDRPPRPPLPPTYNSDFDRSFSSMKVPKLSEFSGEGASEFEIWKYDVNCLINEGVYPTHIIREAMRRSLKGVARGVLLHLGESASVSDILTELEGVYGNVRPAEKLKEMFYSESQREGESVADYSLRLERLLSRVPETLDRYSRNEMLRNRLWSGLRDQELKNVSRYLFERVIDFNTLRRQLRAIEDDLKPQKVSKTGNEPEVKTQDKEQGKAEVADAKRERGIKTNGIIDEADEQDGK